MKERRRSPLSARTRGRSRHPDQLTVRLLAEPHHQRPAGPRGGGAEVAAGAEEMGEEHIIRRAVLLQIEDRDFLAAGHHDAVDALEQGEHISALETLLA